MKTIKPSKSVTLKSFSESPVDHLGALILTNHPIEIVREDTPGGDPFAVVISAEDFAALMKFRNRVEWLVRDGN